MLFSTIIYGIAINQLKAVDLFMKITEVIYMRLEQFFLGCPHCKNMQKWQSTVQLFLLFFSNDRFPICETS